MRKGWEYKKLNEVCEKGASNIVINKLTDNSGEYPLFGASGLVKNIDFFHQDKPYIGIVKDGAGVGRVNIYPAYSSLVGTMQYIFPKEGYSIDFIKYFLVKLDLSHCVSGATIPHIYFKDYGKENIPTPSLDTQLAIVSELDKINELIRLKKEQLKDFDNLAQSIFYEMFGDPVENEMGWEVKKLSSLFKVSSSKRIMQEEWTKEGVPFLKVSDIVSLIKYGEVSPSTFISQLKFEKLEKANMVPMVGDILITSRGTLGLCYTIKTGDKFYFQDGMVTWLSENSGDIIPIYITYLFSNNHFLEVLAERANKSTVSYISIKQISQKKITIPPLPLQHLFSQRIEQIEHQKSEVQKAITDLETLLASRMQYWFE